MAKNIIDFNTDSEIVLIHLRDKALKEGVDVSNKSKLVNYALTLLKI